jgi:hypothetical protein
MKTNVERIIKETTVGLESFTNFYWLFTYHCGGDSNPVERKRFKTGKSFILDVASYAQIKNWAFWMLRNGKVDFNTLRRLLSSASRLAMQQLDDEDAVRFFSNLDAQLYADSLMIDQELSIFLVD